MCNASFGTPEAFLAALVCPPMRVCPSPPSREPRRGEAIDGYATLRRKRIEASEIRDACAAWMRACGARATVAQRVQNAERMQRCFRVMAYCQQQMAYMDMQSEAIRAGQRAREAVPVEFPGMRPMYERASTKRKAPDADISRRAHAYRNIGPPSRKRPREPEADVDVEDLDPDEIQSHPRRRGIRGLYGPGDAYGDDGGTVEFGSTVAAHRAHRG